MTYFQAYNQPILTLRAFISKQQASINYSKIATEGKEKYYLWKWLYYNKKRFLNAKPTIWIHVIVIYTVSKFLLDYYKNFLQ